MVPPPKHNERVQRKQSLTGSNPTYGMSTRLPKLRNGFTAFKWVFRCLPFTQTMQLTQFVFHPGLKIRVHGYGYEFLM